MLLDCTVHFNGRIWNNNEKFRSFKSKENIHKKEVGPYRGFGYQSLISDPINLAKGASEKYCKFVIFYMTVVSKTDISRKIPKYFKLITYLKVAFVGLRFCLLHALYTKKTPFTQINNSGNVPSNRKKPGTVFSLCLMRINLNDFSHLNYLI